MTLDKNALRRESRERTAALDGDVRLKYDRQILREIIDAGLVRGAVCVYNALPSEAGTVELTAYALTHAHAVYMPVVVGDEIKLARVEKKTEFRRGAFGISEPTGKLFEPSATHIDVCFTPLSAFDADMTRLGKGKGFYDRFFAVCDCLKVGVAYEEQRFASLPREEHDVALDCVITQNGMYRKYQ